MGAAGPRGLPRRPARGGAGGRRRRPASSPSRSSASPPTSRPRTPLPVLADGTPLCRLDDLRERPHAYVKLWKHHAAGGQAERINAVARERGEPWLARYGGLISSEWEFAKGLQILEEDPEVYERMDRFVEAADWIVWQLCGRETRNTCTAGYKGIFQDGELPVRGLPARARRALRELRLGEDRRPAGPARRAGRRPHRAGRAMDRSAGGNRRRGRQCGRTCHRARRAGDRARPDARRHGNFDVPHHER